MISTVQGRSPISKPRRSLWLALAVLGALLVAPSVASAAPRYATPTPDGVADCSEAHPCSLQTAVEAASNGDEVIVNEGTYNEGTNQLHPTVPNISIHGAAGQQRPVINFGAMGNVAGVWLSASNPTVRRLTIDYGGTNNAFLTVQSGGVGEQLLVKTTTGTACGLNSDAFTLRDSVCSTSANQHSAIDVINFGNATWTVTLRNVTTVGSGSPGYGIYAPTSGTSSTTIDAKNVIANGGSGTSYDILAHNSGDAGASATVNLAHSNYDSECEQPPPFGSCTGAAGVTITDPGSGTNQTAAPVFADPQFHQAANSPTIDRGTSDPTNGSADIDGDQRSLGTAVDIGADEYVPPPPPDSDHDGVPDPSDACPSEPGPASNNGCPLPADSDGDGIPDASDACPNEAGPASNNGCPDGGTKADTDPPETKIAKAAVHGETATIRFRSDEPGSSFQCKLDRRPFRGCKSPKRYRNLDPGKHTFRVRATDASGNVDASPARKRFEVEA